MLKRLTLLPLLVLLTSCMVLRPLPLSAQSQVKAVLQLNAIANGNGLPLNTNLMATSALTVNCASCSGGTQVNFEGTEDGTNYVAITATNLAASATGTSTTTSGVTTWQLSVTGLTFVRARISAYSAGTVTVTGTSVALGGGGGGGGSGGGGAITAASGAFASGSFAAGSVSAGAYVAGSILDGADVTEGTKTDAKCLTTDATACTMNALSKEQAAALNLLSAAVVPVSTSCAVTSTASNNSTSCKGSAGNRTGWWLINTSSTIYYVRLYNTATAPTCSSATGFVISIPVPQATSAGAGIAFAVPNSVAFATGLGYCITANPAPTDNNNAATGIFGEIYYN